MEFLRHLSSEEARTLEAVLASLSDRAKHRLTLNSLLQQWSYFVSQVEQGYGGSIYDYTNDLSGRDVIEKVLLATPTSLGNRLLTLIHPLDERFNSATSEVECPLLPTTTQKPLAYWWFRIPKKLGEELEHDLRSEGHIR